MNIYVYIYIGTEGREESKDSLEDFFREIKPERNVQIAEINTIKMEETVEGNVKVYIYIYIYIYIYVYIKIFIYL
jgi:hypothetical protein